MNIGSTLLGLLTSVMLARILGPDGRGGMAAVQNPSMILLGVGTLGITTAAGYYSGREPELAGRLMTTALAALLFWSLPLVAMLYWLTPFLLRTQASSVIQSAQMYLLIIPIQFAIGVPSCVLQGLGEYKVWNILRFQGPIAWLAAIGLAWWLGMVTIEAVSVFYLAGMLAVASVFVVAAWRRVSLPHQYDGDLLIALLRYGLPISLTAVIQQLNLRLDQLLIASFLSADKLGLYVVAVAWSSAFSPLLTSVSQVIAPKLAATHDQKAQAFTLHRTLRLCFVIAAVLGVVLLTLTPLVLPVLFGAAFVSAVPTALITVVAGGIASLNQVAGECLRGLGAPKLPIIAEALGLATTLVMLLLLLRRYEILGAALASLTSYIITLTTLILLIARRTQVSPLSFLSPRREDIQYLWRGVREFTVRFAG